LITVKVVKIICLYQKNRETKISKIRQTIIVFKKLYFFFFTFEESKEYVILILAVSVMGRTVSVETSTLFDIGRFF
jgi:hypothetical protein